MRKHLRNLTALCLALALLAGCGTAETTPEDQEAPLPTAPPAEAPETPAEDPEPEGFSLTYAPTIGFNPYSCVSQPNRTALSLLYEPLFTVNSDFEAQPYLCETYTASGDGRTHNLTLRPGVTFSDGSALTAADVMASIQAAQGSVYYGQRLRCIASMTAASDRELTIHTDSAVGALDALLSIYVVKAGTAEAQIPVGTGPYRADGNKLRRTDWWRDETPTVDCPAIDLAAAETASAVRDCFEYGQADVVCTDPNTGSRINYHADFELWNNNTTIFQYVGFNMSSTVFSRGQIRSAVTYAVDRDAIVSDTAGGFAQAASLPASPSAACYDRRLADQYHYNPEAFRAAMKTAGAADLDGDGILDVYTDDGTQSLTANMIVCGNSQQRIEAAQAVADSLNSLGLGVTLHVLEYDDYVNRLRQGNFDLYYGEVRLSPNFDLTPFFLAGGSVSYGGLADEAVAQLCLQALENEGNAYDLHREILERGLLCPVLFKVYAIYSARGRVPSLTPCLDAVFIKPIVTEDDRREE